MATWLHGKHRNKRDKCNEKRNSCKRSCVRHDVEAATAAGRTDYKGQTYYFCGSKCKEKFDSSPAQYLGKAAETPKSGHGCCS
jgi:YHS domain-containing protein